MSREWLTRIIQAATVAVVLTAVCQELERPEEERRWQGKVAGFIPYDFRPPTLERLRETYWNPYERRVLTPTIFGVGWAINLYALLENLGIIGQADVSEESFLMPTESLKQILKESQPTE